MMTLNFFPRFQSQHNHLPSFPSKRAKRRAIGDLHSKPRREKRSAPHSTVTKPQEAISTQLILRTYPPSIYNPKRTPAMTRYHPLRHEYHVQVRTLPFPLPHFLNVVLNAGIRVSAQACRCRGSRTYAEQLMKIDRDRGREYW